jgi:HAD superfamily hydrolase (TIGR01490 family)
MSSVDDLWYRCHAFDLDNTLVSRNTSYTFCNFLCERQILPKRALLEALAARFQLTKLQKNLSDVHKAVFSRVLKGIELIRLESVVDEFLDTFLLDSIYPPAYTVFKRQQHLGSMIVLLSSSPAFLVRKVSERLGVDHWMATDYETDTQGRLNSVKCFLDGKAKAEEISRLSLEKNFTLSNCKAYSDSYYDLPFLLIAGGSVAVNPDKRLRLFADKHDWEIL